MDIANNKVKLLMKLHTIMSEVNFIEKDKTNEHFHYDYASEYIIKKTLQAQLVSQKVLFQLSVIDSIKEGNVTTAKFVYHFIDAETGEDLEGTFVGQGQDNADKGIWKAITGSIKYILTSTFLIPTGDDPENDDVKTPAPVKTTYVNTYKPNQVAPVTKPASSWKETVIHFGKNKGLKLGDVDSNYLNWLIEKWQPSAGYSTKENMLLREALDQVRKSVSPFAPEEDGFVDDPYGGQGHPDSYGHI